MCKKECELDCILPDYAVVRVNHDLPGQEPKPVEVRTPRLFWDKMTDLDMNLQAAGEFNHWTVVSFSGTAVITH